MLIVNFIAGLALVVGAIVERIREMLSAFETPCPLRGEDALGWSRGPFPAAFESNPCRTPAFAEMVAMCPASVPWGARPPAIAGGGA